MAIMMHRSAINGSTIGVSSAQDKIDDPLCEKGIPG
jgi:hypothetical protein